jgi:hypothetical protein
MPWADSMLEKANLPAGDFGIAVITKKTPV